MRTRIVSGGLLGCLALSAELVVSHSGDARAQGLPYFTSWQAKTTSAPETVQNGGDLIAVCFTDPAEEYKCPPVIESNALDGLPVGIATKGGGLSEIDPLLSWMSDNGIALDYMIMDIEGDTPDRYQLIYDNVDRVRNDPDPGISQARVGNFTYYPGISVDTTGPWPNLYGIPLKVAREAVYASSGLNVAMPRAYNTSQHALHVAPSHSGIPYVDGAAPTALAAIFWAAVETVSVAARHLPHDHLLIPYIADFENLPFYGVPQDQVVLPVDNMAQVQHYRMRGAHGFRTWQINLNQSGSTTYYIQTYGTLEAATLAFSADMADAWQALDGAFAVPGAQRLLNLQTNKNAGIQWSGLLKGNRAHILISNLNTVTQHVNWDAVAALPSQSPDVAYREHVSLRYRANVMDREDYEEYYAGLALNDQDDLSWVGETPEMFSINAPPGTGNSSAQSIVSIGGYNSKNAWSTFPGPEFTSMDRVVYSGRLYNAVSGVAFEAMNTAGASPVGRATWSYQGPTVSMAWGALHVRARYDSGDVYKAVNVPPTTGAWLEVKLVVDPSVGTGLGSLYVRNLSAQQTDFTRVVFDNLSTSGTTERLLYVPLELGTNSNPSNLDGFLAVAYGNGNALDDLGMGYHSPDMSDDFEHYQAGVTMLGQATPELVWQGPSATGPQKWTAAAPHGTGNTSTLAVGPVSGAGNTRAWWKTERPDYSSGEAVIYSARLYGTNGVSFSPVNTDASQAIGLTPNTHVGFLAQFTLGHLRLRGSRDWGEVYKATNFEPNSGKWYEIQVQVDPTRDIDGVQGGAFGAARVWVKNLTDHTEPVLMSFDKISTTGVVEALAEIPLLLNSTVLNTTKLNGWELGATSSTVQVDQLHSALYPYADFVNQNHYIEN